VSGCAPERRFVATGRVLSPAGIARLRARRTLRAAMAARGAFKLRL